MNNQNIESIAALSFDQIFDDTQGSLSYERIEAFMNRIIQIAAEQAKINPNQLVRVVSGERVSWMTQKQAVEFLEVHNTADMRLDVEHAIKGNLDIVRKELEILLAIAFYTLDQFLKQDLFTQKEYDEIKPTLVRRQRELNLGVEETAEHEAILSEKRKRTPFINDYEKMMAEFLTCKANNQLQQAAEIAKQLHTFKQKYVLLTRGMEPDVRTIYYHRLNLQKTKKRILFAQRNLCTTRQNQLTVELKRMKNKLVLVQKETTASEVKGLGNAANNLRREELDEHEIKVQMAERARELLALEKESAIIEQQEKQVQAVIDHISVDVLKEQDVKQGLEQALKTVQTPKIDTRPTTLPVQKPSSRMYTKRERNR